MRCEHCETVKLLQKFLNLENCGEKILTWKSCFGFKLKTNNAIYEFGKPTRYLMWKMILYKWVNFGVEQWSFIEIQWKCERKYASTHKYAMLKPKVKIEMYMIFGLLFSNCEKKFLPKRSEWCQITYQPYMCMFGSVDIIAERNRIPTVILLALDEN